jgi:hypothetical protein
MEPTFTYSTPNFSRARMRLTGRCAAAFNRELALMFPGKKAARMAARTATAIAAGRKTFAQLREEAAAQNPDRYAFCNLGTRKTGMLDASLHRGK